MCLERKTPCRTVLFLSSRQAGATNPVCKASESRFLSRGCCNFNPRASERRQPLCHFAGQWVPSNAESSCCCPLEHGPVPASKRTSRPLKNPTVWPGVFGFAVVAKDSALPDLGTAREGPGVTFARDPAAPSTLYVYTLLGRQSAAVANTSYEFLTVTVAANGRQTVANAWTAGTLASAQARWQAGAWTVDATVSALYTPPTSYVFIGGGLTAAGGGATKVEAGLVAAGGQLQTSSVTSPTLLDDTPRDFAASIAGYGVCAANDQVFVFGGLNAVPSAGAESATLVSPPPAIAAGAWNNEGIGLTHGRYLLGSAVQSAFIFLLGGQTDEPSPASKSTELVIW